MEEKIKVSYKGKILEATKNEAGAYRLELPDKGSLKRTITSSEEGWKFEEFDTENPDAYFWLRIKDNGTVEYANDMSSRVKVLEKNYDPELSYIGVLDEVTRDLYGVTQQLKGYEKLGVSPVEVLDLRSKIMGLSLKMLGYQSLNQVFFGEPNTDVSIMDLDHVVRYLETYPAFAQYVSRESYSGVNTVKTKIPEDLDKEEFKKQFEDAKRNYEEEIAYVEDRTEEIARRRDELILPDFCKGLKTKKSASDWEHYAGIVNRLGKLILSFNADLLSPAEKMSVIQGTSLNQLDLLHQVSLITEGEEMDKALAIESYFFIDEANRLAQKVQEDLQDEYIRNSTPGKLMREFSDESLQEAEKREKAIKDRYYYRHVYPYDKSRKATIKDDNEEQEFC